MNVLNPKRATNAKDYWHAVAEWDRDLSELNGFGGEAANNRQEGKHDLTTPPTTTTAIHLQTTPVTKNQVCRKKRWN